MLSRREFIRRSILYALALAGGNTLAGCSQPAPTATSVPPTAPAPSTSTLEPTRIVRATVMPSPVITPTPAMTATPIVRATVTLPPAITPTPAMTATPIAPVAGEPYLVVARGATPAAIMRAAIDAFGGMSKFVKPGSDVILKPNICNAQNGPEYASTTNPEVIAELVKMCLAAGAKRVRVMDQPLSGTAVTAYVRSGIREAVEKAGGEMELMSAAKYTPIDFPATARSLKSQKIYQDILKADVVFNVPIAKHHGSAQLTLTMKNLMGVIQDRNSIHFALDQRIADLSTAIKPTLHIIDGVRVLMNHGPTGGNLNDVKVANTIIVSHDPVAADAYATQFLFNRKPQDIGYIKMGAEMGLGRLDISNLRVKEVTA